MKDILMQYAMQFVGLPYRWGGDDTIDGFDCSGLAIELLRSVGVLQGKFDYTAASLQNIFKDNPCQPQFGALAFFGKEGVGHVGFCLNETLMLEAGGGDSSTITRAIAAKQNAYVRIRPVRSRSDYKGCYMPKYPWRV